MQRLVLPMDCEARTATLIAPLKYQLAVLRHKIISLGCERVLRVSGNGRRLLHAIQYIIHVDKTGGSLKLDSMVLATSTVSGSDE